MTRLGFLFVVSAPQRCQLFITWQNCILDKTEFKPKQFFKAKNDFTDHLKNVFENILGHCKILHLYINLTCLFVCIQ